MIHLNDMLLAIKRAFKYGPPVGSLLGWEANRYYSLICDAAFPHEVVNMTDFENDYNFCNCYSIYVYDKVPPCFWQLTIKLSYIFPVYTSHWVEFKTGDPRKARFLYSIKENDFLSSTQEQVLAVVRQLGFQELATELSKHHVDGVVLHLGGIAHATADRCLFTDHPG